METTMTKLKDLATVTVESAFRLFPVDTERYELYVAVGRHVMNPSDEGCMKTFPITGSHTINEWFLATIENVNCLADAFVRVSAELPGLPAIVYDRARRVTATISNSYDDLVFCPTELLGAPVERVVHELWRCIYGRMVTTHGFSPDLISTLAEGREYREAWALSPGFACGLASARSKAKSLRAAEEKELLVLNTVPSDMELQS
jgi:hypothetical protein